MKKKEGIILGKVAIYLLGILLVSAGIVFCKKSTLGISPISSIPFVLEEVLPLSFGNLTMVFHFVNTAIQMILSEKKVDIKLILQIPLAFFFSVVIDGMQRIIVFDNTVLFNQCLALTFSIFFTAFGIVCMVDMNFIQNPPDGTVKLLSTKLNIELGKMKNGYDIICVLFSAIIGLLFIGKIKGFGIATVASAFLVGRCVSWIRKGIKNYIIKERKICY